jgi:hypothetical protein
MAQQEYGLNDPATGRAWQDVVDKLTDAFKKVKPGTTGTNTNTNTNTNTGEKPGGNTPEAKYVYINNQQATPKYTTPTLPGATSQEAYINSIYDADRKAQEAQLRSAYEQNMADLDYQAAQIPQTYNAAADDAAVQAAIARANFNNSAAGSGLNTGAAGQVALSQNNNYLRNVNAIRTAQAEATAKLNLQRQQQEAQYKSAINAALAQNDLARAQALYNEAKRVDEANMNRAANQAQMDWTVWNALYNRR